jgi:tetrahydroxynaphthalene reductase
LQIEAKNRHAIAIQADVSKPLEIASLFKQAMLYFGHIDIVISNSAIVHFDSILDVTPEEFDRVFAVNTRGQFFVAQQAYKHVTPGGRLILISSVSAQAKGIANHAVYSGSKAAVEAFARCFAQDFGEKCITVNAIAPGGIRTDMFLEGCKKVMPGSEKWSDEELNKFASSWSPLKRPGFVEDISRVTAFLASEDGGWINGELELTQSHKTRH